MIAGLATMMATMVATMIMLIIKSLTCFSLINIYNVSDAKTR